MKACLYLQRLLNVEGESSGTLAALHVMSELKLRQDAEALLM
jgi:hypothetical protein